MPARILLLGHRGARNEVKKESVRENTIAAFDLALRHGADGFEFDVRSTYEGKSIICHDPRLHRLAVRQSTVKQLRAAASSRNEVAPSLEQVLSRYGRTAFLNIEVKVRSIEELVVGAVSRARPQRYFISSFLPSVVRRLHALDNSLVLGALAQTRWQLRRWRILPVIYVVPQYHLLSRRLVGKLHGAGKLVVTWTVNDRKRMLRAAAMGVDGIISDHPGLLVETLGKISNLKFEI